MLEANVLLSPALNFINRPDKKIMLIIGDVSTEDYQALVQFLKIKQMLLIEINLLSMSSDYLAILTTAPITESTILLFTGLEENVPANGFYLHYQLERWQGKIIVLHDKINLHPSLDPGIYFAPIKNHRFQKSLLMQLNLPFQRTKKLNSVTPVVEPKVNGENTNANLLSSHYLNSKLMSNDDSVMRALADRVLENIAFRNFLLQLIYASRNEALSIAAANAITALKYAKFPLTKLNLANVKVPGADLSNAIMDSIQLQGAKLDGARLRGAWLRAADLSGASVNNIKFDEFPYLEVYDEIDAICISANGLWLAVGTKEGKIYLYDYINKFQIHLFTVDNVKLFISKFAFDANSEFLVASGSDQNLRIWRIPDFQLIKTIVVPKVGDSAWSAGAGKAGFTPDNKYLIATHGGGKPTFLYLWTKSDYHLVTTFESQHGCFSPKLTFSLDSHVMVCWCSYMGLAGIWQLNNLRLLHESGDSWHADSAAISPNGMIFALGKEYLGVRLYYTNTNQQFQKFTGMEGKIIDLTFSPSGKYLAGLSGNGTVNLHHSYIYIWDIESLSLLCKIGRPTERISLILFSPDERHLITANKLDISNEKHFVSFLEFSNANQPDMQAEHLVQDPSVISISPNGKLMVCGGTHLQLWNATQRLFLYTLEKPKGLVQIKHSVPDAVTVACLDFSPDNQYLASGGNDSIVWLWDVTTRQVVHAFEGHEGIITDVVFNYNGTILLSNSFDGTTRIWSMESRQQLSLIKGHNNKILSFYFSADEPWESGRIKTLAFSKRTEYLATGGDDGYIKFWKPPETQCFKTLRGHRRKISSVAFCDQLKWLASSSEDGFIYIWHVANFARINILKKLQSSGKEIVSFSPDGKYLTSFGGENNSLLIWETDEEMQRFDAKHILATSVSWLIEGNNTLLITASRDHTLRIWQIFASDVGLQLCLIWSNFQIGLEVSELIAQNAEGLSKTNLKLLQQRGAARIPTTPFLNINSINIETGHLPASVHHTVILRYLLNEMDNYFCCAATEIQDLNVLVNIIKHIHSLTVGASEQFFLQEIESLLISWVMKSFKNSNLQQLFTNLSERMSEIFLRGRVIEIFVQQLTLPYAYNRSAELMYAIEVVVNVYMRGDVKKLVTMLMPLLKVPDYTIIRVMLEKLTHSREYHFVALSPLLIAIVEDEELRSKTEGNLYLQNMVEGFWGKIFAYQDQVAEAIQLSIRCFKETDSIHLKEVIINVFGRTNWLHAENIINIFTANLEFFAAPFTDKAVKIFENVLVALGGSNIAKLISFFNRDIFIQQPRLNQKLKRAAVSAFKRVEWSKDDKHLYDANSVAALIVLFEGSADFEVRETVIKLLVKTNAECYENVVKFYISILQDESCSDAVEIALGGIIEKRNDLAEKYILPMLRSKQNLHKTLLSVLSRIKDESLIREIIPALIPLLSSPIYETRSAAAYTVGYLGIIFDGINVASHLTPMLEEDDRIIRLNTIEALGRIGAKYRYAEILPHLMPFLHWRGETANTAGIQLIKFLEFCDEQKFSELLELLLQHGYNYVVDQTRAEVAALLEKDKIFYTRIDAIRHNKNASPRLVNACNEILSSYKAKQSKISTLNQSDAAVQADSSASVSNLSTASFWKKPRSRDNRSLSEVLKIYQLAKETLPPSPEKALRRAAACGTEDDVRYLVKHVTDIDAQDDDRSKLKTALHWAVANNKIRNAEILINAGARTDIEDAPRRELGQARGKTVMDYLMNADDAMRQLFGRKFQS